MDSESQKIMKRMWNQRAKANAFYYIESAFWDGDIDKFFELGKERTDLLLDPLIQESHINTLDASILEIGCGVGRFSREFSRRFKQVTAVDVSDEVIQKAKALHPSTDYPNLNFHSTDGTSLSFVDTRSIDLVFSYEVFQHMPSADVILSNLKEVSRVLKPQGYAYVHLMTDKGMLMKTGKNIVKQIIPQQVLKALGYAPLTFDKTWTGTSLSIKQIQSLCQAANLSLVKLVDDSTTLSDRVFLLAKPI
jgi:ubiquinone/menaquinone biosynthesis C-methylase UbiE